MGFEDTGLGGEFEAARGEDAVEVRQAGEALVGHRLTGERPQALGRLQFGAAGKPRATRGTPSSKMAGIPVPTVRAKSSIRMV